MKKKYKISGLDCPSCASLIEMNLGGAGVSCRCSFASQTLEIDYVDITKEEIKVIEIVKKSGYIIS